MERAALGVACLAAAWAPPGTSRLLVLCGPGDNGGDGYAAARQLSAWGLGVRVLDLAGEPARGASARLERELCARQVGVERVAQRPAALVAALAEATHVVDALFGVGLTRALEGWWREVIDVLEAAGRPVLSIDVPSGLDADRGEPLPVAVHAQVTATMVAPKPGLLPPTRGAAYAGTLVEIDIGLPWALHAPWLLSTSHDRPEDAIERAP